MTIAMTSEIRYAWLQKHPSPAASHGEFHWYPAEGDRELRASLVERSRAVESPAVLWQLEPGRVSWARVFTATAPTDGRRYTGLVVATAEGAGAPPAELLAALAVPPAAPWSEAGGWDAGGRRAGGETAFSAAAAEVSVIARGLLGGGDAALFDPERGDLPGLVASVERWMPPMIAARRRRGAWRGGAVPQGADRVAGLVASAWREPGGRGAQAWRLLCELAAVRAVGVDEVVAGMVASDGPAAALFDAERAALGEVRDFAGVLHAWGRGRLDRTDDAVTLATRLADGVALRVLARLMADQDPGEVIAAVRWYALLPGARRAALLDAMVGRAASLRALVEVPHG